MMLYLGTSGYSYKAWKGYFYPNDLPATKMLEYYSRHFSSVEVNNTFYRMPKAEVVAAWRDTVPEGFRFVLKANMRLTHRQRLKEAGETLAFMTRVFSAMEGRLGAVLYQLPPNFKKDLARLDGFLELLPEGTRAAFEFRHATWFDEEVYACLSKHRCALVVSDVDDEPAPSLEPLCDWGYLRLRRENYTPEDLDIWADRLKESGWKEIFCFFKHEEEGTGPRLAKDFESRFESDR